MNKMRVLIACEESQRVCIAFRALGHEAYSCDILECSGGHPERKATCLWLKGLPPLKPTNIVEPDIIRHKSGRTDSRLHFETLKLHASERSKIRSKTFEGIAKAMAEQWGNINE